MRAFPFSSPRAAQAGVFLALAPLVLGTAFAANPPAPAAAAPAAPKTHVLFMGANLALEKNKSFHPVEDVTSTTLVIKSGGKPVSVSLDEPANLQINEALKLAEASVGIGGLKVERAYTPGTDPYLKMLRADTFAAGESAAADAAQARSFRVQMDGAFSSPGSVAEVQASVAQQQASAAMDEAPRALNAATTYASSVVMEEMFDAIRLSFVVTSDRDLAQPYYAFIARIRDRDSKPGQLRQWAFVKSLGPMSAGVPKHVDVYRGGMPPGYILENSEVHLYNRGEELATNLSRKRVPLSDEEALDYRIIEYVGANKGRTLPAVPAVAKLPSGWRERLAPGQLSETCYASVGKDGKVLRVFSDVAGKQPVQDAQLEAVVKGVRFKPALEAGKPVERITPVSLGELAR